MKTTIIDGVKHTIKEHDLWEDLPVHHRDTISEIILDHFMELGYGLNSIDYHITVTTLCES
tara:strand:- start:287 stop:469 length:183 start_codon:yes stop_codon:yes gene_type:complete